MTPVPKRLDNYEVSPPPIAGLGVGTSERPPLSHEDADDDGGARRYYPGAPLRATMRAPLDCAALTRAPRVCTGVPASRTRRMPGGWRCSGPG